MSNRDSAAILRFHEFTKHSAHKLRGDPHFLDWDIMPRPFKVYLDLEAISLAREIEISSRPALVSVSHPGASTGGSIGGPPQVDLKLLARLIHFSAGVLKRRTHPGGETFFRAAACTGNLHHVDQYLVCAALPDLEAGVYHVSPHDFALRRLRAGDHRSILNAATADEPAIVAAPAIIACASTYWRNSWKYRARAYRHCYWDDGTMLANLLAVAAAADLPARVVLGFVDDQLNHLLDLDTDREVTLSLVALGSGATRPPASPAVESLGLRTLTISEGEVDYPEIRAAHAASSLSSPDEVASWRARVEGTRPAPETGPLIPLADASLPSEPVEGVILRRGSTRRFSRDPIQFDTLSTLLRSVTRGIPADFVAPGTQLADLYVIANAVDGLEAGTYFFDRERDGLVALRHGEFRRQAGYLGLGQELPADAAVNLYWLTDLQPVLERFGNRGYRAAQLEAAIAGGKTYLAAFALGFGATGLTFFDDDVTEFFSPHAAGKSVMFLMALGLPAGSART